VAILIQPHWGSYFYFTFLLPCYLNFKVTTASTIVRMVTTQNLTAILLS
jgi:hypothetical protein